MILINFITLNIPYFPFPNEQETFFLHISFKKRYTVILPRMWKYKGGTQKTFLQHTGSMVHSCAAISKQEPLFPDNSGGGALYEEG